ncbi:MAG TPA: flagellar basal-body MS-ring/collar protein FliF [Lacisediminihabitans sp.]|jgi:flagellar M-ring protein FliF|nr:flagellar basal-body MS-ring/collar protein FliF [Lacisediminihabitans sp.]HXD62168.1 flagellar basal-body MS-ring/collar protein FliF [Lacisediminihabitans sp.]
MPAQVTSAFKRLFTAIREFTIAQRTLALIGVAVLVLGIAGLTVWVSQPSYTPLFSGLAASDASTIVDQLKTDNVPYQLSDGGATILVPEANVYNERLKAASAGLPTSSNGGYSLLDKMGVTASEFQQSVTYKRAIEGELASTIQALKGVKMASVQLAIPKDTVFTEQKTDPTASVFIKTDSGVTLSSDQVQAIVHLTSASIDGMKATDVAVIDSDGQVLSAVGTGATGSATKQSSDYETSVRDSVQSMLDRVVGPGNATVAVAADMSQESANRVEETYSTPEGSPTISESTDKQTGASGTGGSGTATGVLGPDNIAVPSGGGTTTGATSESQVKNNAVNKVTENRTIPAGAITRQTVSVALNSKAATGLKVSEISALVSAAAGINTTRGDKLSVEVVPFSTTGATTAAQALNAAAKAAEADRLTGIITTAIITAGVVLPVLVILFLLRRRSRRRNEEEEGLLSEMLNAPTVPMQLPVARSASQLQAPVSTTQSLESAPISPSASEAASRRADIEAFAQRDPQKTAEYLRSMMDDRQPA